MVARAIPVLSDISHTQNFYRLYGHGGIYSSLVMGYRNTRRDQSEEIERELARLFYTSTRSFTFLLVWTGCANSRNFQEENGKRGTDYMKVNDNDLLFEELCSDFERRLSKLTEPTVYGEGYVQHHYPGLFERVLNDAKPG
jgi:hypothetical protein